MQHAIQVCSQPATWPPTSPTSHINQLHQNLRVACHAQDATLCLRVIVSLLSQIPGCSLALVDQFCDQHRLPLLLVANTSDKWNARDHMCVCMQDGTSECPYFVQLYLVPHNMIPSTLARFPFDPTRPHWVRTMAENRLYLDKCGLLLPKDQVCDMRRDLVMMGRVKLSIVSK